MVTVLTGFLVMEVSFYFAKVADVSDINVLSSLLPHHTLPQLLSSTLPSHHSTTPSSIDTVRGVHESLKIKAL
jgi:hypothetical protein